MVQQLQEVPGKHLVSQSLYSEASIEQLQQQSLKDPNDSIRRRSSSITAVSSMVEEYIGAKSPEQHLT